MQTDVLRTSEQNFDELKNGSDLFNFIAQGKDNYEKGFTRAGVACNLTLFGNHAFGCNPCNTLYYFLEGTSARPVEFDAILRSYFTQLGNNPLFDRLAQQLGDYYRSNLENARAGGLLQFFIPKENIGEASFVCGGRGRIIDQNGEPIKNPQKIFEAFQKGETVNDASIRHNEIQARLHAYLVRFPNARVFDYFSTPNISLEAIDAEIKKILEPYLVPLLVAIAQNSGLYKYSPPTFQLFAKETIGNAQWERDQPIPPAITAALQADVVTLKKILDEDPDVDVSYLDRDTLKLVRLNDFPAYHFAQKFSLEVVEVFADKFGGLSVDCQFSFMESILKMPMELVKPELFTALNKHIFSFHSVINIIQNTRQGQREAVYKLLANMPASNDWFNSEISALEDIVMHGNLQTQNYLYKLINRVHNIDIVLPTLLIFKNYLANERAISVIVQLAERLPQNGEKSLVESYIQSIREVLNFSNLTVRGLEILLEKFSDNEAMFSLIHNQFPRYFEINYAALWKIVKDYDELQIKCFFSYLSIIPWQVNSIMAAGEKFNLDYIVIAEFFSQAGIYSERAFSSSKLPQLIEGYELIKLGHRAQHLGVIWEYLAVFMENDAIEHFEMLKAIEAENLASELGVSQFGQVFKIYCQGDAHIKKAIDLLLNQIKTNDHPDRNAVTDMCNFWFIFEKIQPFISYATEYLERLFMHNPGLRLEDLRQTMGMASNS